MRIQQALRTNGLLGMTGMLICIVIGHDFHMGRACIRCGEPKRLGD